MDFPEWLEARLQERDLRKVELAGAEFKAMILNAVDDMLRAWLVRPRGVRTYLQVSLGRLFEAPVGVRGAPQHGEKLVYYGPVELGDGGTTDLLLSASEVDAGSRRCRVTGQVACEDIERAYLLYAGALYEVAVEDDRFVFEPVPLRDGESDLLLILESRRGPDK